MVNQLIGNLEFGIFRCGFDLTLDLAFKVK